MAIDNHLQVFMLSANLQMQYRSNDWCLSSTACNLHHSMYETYDNWFLACQTQNSRTQLIMLFYAADPCMDPGSLSLVLIVFFGSSRAHTIQPRHEKPTFLVINENIPELGQKTHNRLDVLQSLSRSPTTSGALYLKIYTLIYVDSMISRTLEFSLDTWCLGLSIQRLRSSLSAV